MAQFRFTTFLSLFRALFPNWNFFDRIAYGFELYYKIPSSENWEPMPFEQTRKVWQIVFNPSINLALAQVSLIEHFARDIQESENANAETLPSFILLSSLVAVKLSELGIHSETFQFKVIGESSLQKVEVFESDWLSVNGAQT